jgi:protein-ribulosamine 3-kinase
VFGERWQGERVLPQSSLRLSPSYLIHLAHQKQVGYRTQHAEMALGEYESQKALAQYLPDNSVVPIAFGTFELDPAKSFFLTTYRELKEKTPDPEQLVEVIAKLHKESASPTGKFGFHVTTFNGHVPLQNDWCDSWEQWYSRQLRSDIRWEQSVRGVDPNFNKVADQFFDIVIPRLLRPLQSNGRSIKPTLVHGDLWHGNAQVDMDTNRVILFDSCCCYAHNESTLFAIVVGDLTSDQFLSGAPHDEAATLSFYSRVCAQI